MTREEQDQIQALFDEAAEIIRRQETPKLKKAGPYGWVGQALWRLSDLQRYIENEGRPR
jgi:hypothetical protein